MAGSKEKTEGREPAVFRIPLLLGVVSVIGLLSALLGDGVFDILSWIALGAPLAVIAGALLAARSSAARR